AREHPSPCGYRDEKAEIFRDLLVLICVLMVIRDLSETIRTFSKEFGCLARFFPWSSWWFWVQLAGWPFRTALPRLPTSIQPPARAQVPVKASARTQSLARIPAMGEAPVKSWATTQSLARIPAMG